MKTLKPAHLTALRELAEGRPLTAKRGARGLWLAGLAEYAADGTTLVITEAGRAALAAEPK